MNKKFMNFLLDLVVKVRGIIEPLTWKLFSHKDWESLEDLGSFDDIKDLSPKEFSKSINTFDYKYDPINGLLDYSFPFDKPQYFFKNLPWGRDCDDWARIWSIYYNRKGVPVQEWVVTEKEHPFTKSHFIAVAKEEDGWHLLNYNRYPKGHETPEEAINDIEGWNNGYYEEFRLQSRYKEY